MCVCYLYVHPRLQIHLHVEVCVHHVHQPTHMQCPRLPLGPLLRTSGRPP